MASVDKSLDAANRIENASLNASSSCLNDPNYAIICVFLQKFGGQLKIEHPDFLRLQKMIENTDEVHEELKQFFVRLLRKTRKSVQPDKLDSALAKFCYTYSAQDAWEVERFGYKKSSLAVKLRILKEVLESQFDKNPNFRTLISAQTATELRSQPLGKDKLGNAYWSTVDEQCNLRIYQEHLDEEIWKVVATNRDEMAKLIACLKGNELVMPSLVGIIDEDSSSNSMPPKVDALQTENGTSNGNESDDKNVPCLKIKLNPGGGESTVEQISNDDNANGAKIQSQNNSVADEEEDASVMSEIDELSQAASESSATTVGTKSNETQGSKRISLMASKPPSNANKLKLRIFATDKKTMKRNLDEDCDTETGKSKRPSMHKTTTDDDSEYESDELSDEEFDENDLSGDDEIGPAIEEPTMYVHGEGSGAANNSQYTWPEFDESDECDEIGDAIEEEVFFVFGEGSGHDCDVGNNDIKPTEASASSTTTAPVIQSKPMFFFGQAGCLKLSPMKPAVVTVDNSSASNKNNTETESSQESSSLANETITNATNSVALDAKNNSNQENVANNDKTDADETDKGISIVNESSALTIEPKNAHDQSEIEQIKQIESSSKEIITESDTTTNIETPDSNAVVENQSGNDNCSENIESNSSVALANISVQEETIESVREKDEPLTTTSDVLQTESHLLNDKVKESEVNDECQENRESECELTCDDVNLVAKDNESVLENELETNKIDESSENVKETNVLENLSENASENVSENENKSDDRLSDGENEPIAEVKQAVVDPVVSSVAVEDAPIENETSNSSKTDEQTDESKPIADDHEPQADKSAITIESNVDEHAVEENLETIEKQSDDVSLNVLTKESNNEDKTESPQEQNVTESNVQSSLPIDEPNTSEETVQLKAPTPEPEVSQIISPTASESPIKNEIHESNESNEFPHEVPSERITESIIVTKDNEDVAETSVTSIEHSNETLPISNKQPEQESTETLDDQKTVTDVQSTISTSIDIPNEPLADDLTNSKDATTEPIPPQTEAIESDIKESLFVDTSIVAESNVQAQESLAQQSSALESSVSSPLDQPESSNSEPVPVAIKEKRKSIDRIEEASECKKICEAKILEELPQPPVEIDLNAPAVEEKVNEVASTNEAIPKPLDIPQPSKPVEIVESNSETEINRSESSNILDESAIPPTEEVSANSTETSVETRHETSNEETDNQTEATELTETTETIFTKSNLSTENTVEGKIEAAVIEQSPNKDDDISNKVEEDTLVENKEKPQSIEMPVSEVIEKSATETQTAISRTTQLRNRKRRISGEKPRHLSESDDNNDSLIDSPLSQDASSDEEVGGKRIKMRPKLQVRRTTRKSVEQKRNIKDTEWSSDENEMPNAKRATNDVSKACEKVLLSPEKITPKEEESILPASLQEVDKEVKLKTEDTSSSIKEESKDTQQEAEVKQEADEESTEHQSEEEQATPNRRPGRPARRRGRKPGPKPKPKPANEIKTEDAQIEPSEENATTIEEKPTPVKPETRRKKRSLMGLDIADVETIQAAADADTPVRQSRRIAQIKIREEAERRKAEEVALQKMKEASEKKKKGTVVKQSESEEENSESEAKLEKKKRRKKGNKDKPWQTDSDDSSEREEEDVYEHEDVERLEPLRSDHEFSPESDIEDESQIVPTKRARTARKDKTDRREEESEEEEEDIHACQKCSKSDHPEWILLCDKCDKGYHCSCLIPVLFVIPEGNWFCPPCQQEKLIDELEAKLLEFDNMVQQKEIEEAQRQRLLLTTISEANVLKDTKRDRERARNQDDKHGSEDGSSNYSSTPSDSEVEEKETKNTAERRTRSRPTNRQRNRSESSEQSESSDNTSDNEPIYKLRKRRQANVSYRFNEYDELINRAIKSEMDEVAGAGNLGRGKDIATIMEADKEEKRLKKLEQQQKERELAGDTNEKDDDDSDDQPLKVTKEEKSDGDSDSEPIIRPKAIKRSKTAGRKKKKLNSLDDDSDEEADSSDDDFNTSSYSDEDEEDDSSAASDSSLDSIVKKKGKGRGSMSTRRSVRERKKRYDADFIDDSSFDDEDNVPLVKKKKKVESDFSDFDGSSEELEEDVDSEDLCDDSTDESDRSWGKKKSKSKPTSKKSVSKSSKKKPDAERAFKAKPLKKKSKISEDDDDDDDDDDDESQEGYGKEVLPKSRRTRGKKLPYLLDDDFDSSDDGIKPGVKRPDTPPEERAAFIKKQEEIKRMLAEKGTDATQAKDSLSTIPHSIIQSAKALDVDLKKTAILNKNTSDNDSNDGFDDDLPEDFDPEDMDEDAIAKMMEEEEFAQQQLKLAGETILRNRKLKDALTDPMKKEDSPAKLTIETGPPSVIMPPNIPPALVSPLPLSTSQLTIPDIPPSMYTAQQFQGANNKTTPKKRGRKTKDDVPLIIPKEQQPPPLTQSLPQISTVLSHNPPINLPQNKPNALLNIPSVLQHAPAPSQLFSSPTIQHTSSVIAHSSRSVIQHQQPQRLPSMPQPAVPSILGIAQNREPIIPSTVLDVQNTRLLDPSELGKPPDDLLDPATKKQKARSRKKITPTRDSLITSPPNVTVTPHTSVTLPGITQPPQATIPNIPVVAKPPSSSILSERLTANPSVEKSGLTIATPPQLYSPSSRSQASVITRLARPSQSGRQPFPSGQSSAQRFFASASNTAVPPHSAIPSTVPATHARPYHAPNVTVASGQRPPPLVAPPPHTSGHLPHPMYMRGQPGIYAGYPNIQPPPMHRSLQSIEHATNSAQNFTAPYQNIPFGSYYAAAAAGRSGAIIGTFEPFDNKNPSSHERLPAYAHPSLGLAALATRNPTGGDVDDDRSAQPGVVGHGGSTSEFSGLVSYFSSQQDDLDS